MSKHGCNRSSMRILHLNQFSSRAGGVESYIADAAAALRALGHESHLVSFTPQDPVELITATTYAPLPDWPAPIERATDVIAHVIGRFKPDVAYVHAVYNPDLVAWLAQRLPTVAYIHGPYPVCPGSSQYLRRSERVCPERAGAICLLNAQLEKCCWGRSPIKHRQLLARVKAFEQAHRAVRHLIVGSRFMYELMVRGAGPAQHVSILAPVLIQEPLPALVAATGSRRVLYAGRLTPEKGLRHLIKALAMVQIDWQLVVAGDGPERAACQTLTDQLGIADRVEWVGWLSDVQMQEQYRRCALAVCPSLWPEPFGRIGPEAYIHGKPVIAYATGGIPDWLENDLTGYLVEPGDIATLARRIQAVLESPTLQAQLGENARRTAVTHWQAQAHARALQRVFEAALGA